MKKKILFVAAILGASFGSIAQDDNADKVFTPEAGDWALGFDAAPALNYFGNMFNGTQNNSLSSDFVHNDFTNQALFGKYYVDATTAYRGSIRLMSNSTTTNVLTDTILGGGYNNGAPGYYNEEYKTSNSMILIGGGLEKRKGDGRFQGYYGGELMIALGGGPKNTNTYDVAMTTESVADGYATSGRILSAKAGGTFGLGLRGFAGVEYFVLPKISLGAEFGWHFMLNTTGEGEQTTENWGLVVTNGTAATDPSAYEVTTTTAKSSSFDLDTDNFGGNIKLMFHF